MLLSESLMMKGQIMRLSCVVVRFSSVALSGCSIAPSASSSPTDSIRGAALQGTVHGWRQPVVGANVYLYAANVSGAAGWGIAASSSNASVSLLKSAANTTADVNGNYHVTTDSNGLFTITGDYTCPSAASQVYLYAVGGNAGSGSELCRGVACRSGHLSGERHALIIALYHRE